MDNLDEFLAIQKTRLINDPLQTQTKVLREALSKAQPGENTINLHVSLNDATLSLFRSKGLYFVLTNKPPMTDTYEYTFKFTDTPK